ncbi:MAG: sulfite exporter TauE/SafE family protein [Lachnospiraceae bacterium]|nr:sulfite exporter TauE/SafE family protein [Lachnospiraceae bacterium]
MGKLIGAELLIFGSFLISSIAGFAGAAFAVPLTAGIVGLSNARCAVNIISIAFNSSIVYQQRKKIKLKEIIPILALACTGMMLGFILNNYIKSDDFLTKILGGIILVIAVMRILLKKEIKLNKITSIVIILISGVVNYLFLCGGIILVLYMSQRYREKDAFRGNNGFLFGVQSIIMLFIQASRGMYNQQNIMIGFCGIVPVILATYIGKIILKKISQETFEKVTYWLLLVMAIMLIF